MYQSVRRQFICFKLEGHYEPVEHNSFLGTSAAVLEYLKEKGNHEDNAWTRVEGVDGPTFEVCYNGEDLPRFWRQLEWRDGLTLTRAWAS